jgi:hypothetical protein
MYLTLVQHKDSGQSAQAEEGRRAPLIVQFARSGEQSTEVRGMTKVRFFERRHCLCNWGNFTVAIFAPPIQRLTHFRGLRRPNLLVDPKRSLSMRMSLLAVAYFV